MGVQRYLGEVPVDPHAFLCGLFAVVQARLSFCGAGVGYTAVVVVFVGLNATDVELASASVISKLQNQRENNH